MQKTAWGMLKCQTFENSHAAMKGSAMRYLFDGNTVLEQRYEPRYKTRLAIFYGSGQRQLMTDYSVNISTGGIFIETEKPMPVDTTLFVKFMLPAYGKTISCKTKVAWTNEDVEIKAKDLPLGMGLSFLDLSLDHMHAIRCYINEVGLEPAW
jgi:uncharacterized protein (TIGR02266 family)